jgi:predicted XRE-type DNA-binding protein
MNEETMSMEFTKSSGNVFADMGLDDADELLARAKLGYAIRKILENRNLKQQEIADLLNIKQSEVSKLMNGKYHLFSESRLFSFFNKLEQKIIIQITPHDLGEPLIDVQIKQNKLSIG